MGKKHSANVSHYEDDNGKLCAGHKASFIHIICSEGLHSFVQRLRAWTLEPDLLVMVQLWQWVI